ncbi:BamA/TamA family outer membrane protein [Hyphococcus flavus]|uniref:BamA/TamA family outer membrane protein n=1 Tax=Hyphococcus flavus TaxID=1866326 RepID=A0AAF0CGP1_9PROT|nr:BamA/TamA family outer membrane protein [Hyphococcus flavus]WDI30897.1 BamA/TamA family outer membrane protein [Hyphococcus flavus]
MLRNQRQLIDFINKIPALTIVMMAVFCSVFSPVRAADTYTASIEGADNGLRSKLELISELMKGVREYPTAAALRRAARRDVEEFNKALQAAGFYAGSADFDLVPAEDGGKAEIIYRIDTGPAFRISEYEVLYQDEAEGRPASFRDADIETSGEADGASLKARQQEFLNVLWESGYPAAEIVTRRAIANFETAEASAIFVFRSGPKAKFGDAQVSGAEKTNAAFIRRMKTWKEGEEFERSKLTRYYDKLRETNLFATIDISPGQPGEDGVTPVIVRLEERKQRTIGAGVSYSTAEGPGGRLYFEHRNVFGYAESARVELRASEIEQSVNASITRPMPRLDSQAFASAAFVNETTDAFDARSLKLSAGLSKKWLEDNLETRGAIALETSNVRADGVEDRNYFISTPLSVIWNSENDLLNPTEGFRASWTVTPYTGSETFTQSEISARWRVHFGEEQRVTLAARAALGATFGNSLVSLPLNKRYYAGGGGSVRGYGFQEAGPLDADNDPIGGLSRVDGAIETRVKVINNLQIAGFVDAGSVSSSNVPSFNDEFFIGYGGGIRYITPIGPIRADIAFPLDKRESDADFQIYIALGQPF